MATLMLEVGADIRFIQGMLGHVHLSTTKLYTQVSIHKLEQIHAATHTAEKDGAADGESHDGELPVVAVWYTARGAGPPLE